MTVFCLYHGRIKERKSKIVNCSELTNDMARTYEILMKCFCYTQFIWLEGRNVRYTKSTNHDLEISAQI